MSAAKTSKRLKAQNKEVDMLSKVDRDWTPSSYFNQECTQMTSPESTDGEISDKEVSDKEISDKELTNCCPVCQKWFSRGAALICHIKQCHSYMLSKPNETDIHALKGQVMQWKQRKEKKETSALNSRTGVSHNGSSENETDGVNGVSGRHYTKKDSHRGADDDEEGIDSFPIIGGSVLSNGKVGKGQLLSEKISVVSFQSENAELLDPDQSFSVVRNGARNGKMVRRRRQAKRPVSKKYVSETQSSSESDFDRHKPPITHSKRLNKSEKVSPVKLSSPDFQKRKVYHNPHGPIVNKKPVKPSKNVYLVDFSLIDFSIDDSAVAKKHYKCPHCSERFSSSTLLTYHHMRTHMLSDLQQCPNCGKCYYNRISYANHCRRHVRKTPKK